MKALIFANGTPFDGTMVQQALAHAEGALLIAADGGAHLAQHFGLRTQIVVGDMDSVDPQLLAEWHDLGMAIYRYSPEKNETDLELALMFAAEHGAHWIRVLGAIGGRFDQMLANVYLLALEELRERDVALVAGEQIIRLLRAGEHTLHGEVGDTVSLIPVSGDVHSIRTEGLKYPLRQETLYFGPARGISNVMTAEHAHLSFHSGYLLCVHTRGRA